MNGRTQRVLITGSRDFPYRQLVHDVLNRYRAALTFHDTLIVMHGDAWGQGVPGADQYAAEWAKHHEDHFDPTRATVKNDPHPAAWTAPCRDTCRAGHRRPQGGGGTICPAAGNYRNQEMVDTSPDRALVFSLNDSRGTWDCFDRIRRARILWEAYGAYTPLPEES